MSYVLRDRPDGQFEIVLSRPVVVGVFPERGVAEQFCAYLTTAEPPVADDDPASLARTPPDLLADQAARLDLNEVADEVSPRKPRAVKQSQTHLHAVVDEKPRPAAPKALEPHNLTPDEVQVAFTSIQNGEKIYAVATDFGLTMGQLRGLWANHKRHAQKYMASGGQQPCRLCQRSFTPSISHPDTCARCSHD